MELNKHPFTVVGVAPPRFHGTERFVWPDYWIPMVTEGSDFLQSRTSIAVTVIGRLKPGVTPRQATENLNAIAARAGEGVSGDRRRTAAAADPSGTLRGRRRCDSRISLQRDRAGAAGAGGGMREPGDSVCGARGGSQPGTGAPCGPGIEPAAAGAGNC